MIPPRNSMYYGAVEALPRLRELRAGPLTLDLEGGDLRYVRLGDIEILRRVYVAMRIRNWLTVPPRYSNFRLDVSAHSFRVEFDADHVQDEVNFHWHGRITGSEDGTIRYTMDGEARSAFWKNRIGFCVLHPMQAAGQPIRVEHVDGSVSEGFFPTLIAPQRMVNGQLLPVSPFEDMRLLSHQVQPGIWAKVEFDGDVFELEDQRNWTDASFKTYSTPLRLPFPVLIQAGERIPQSITLSLTGVPSSAASLTREITISYDRSRTQSLPQIGFGSPGHGKPLTESERAQISRLAPAHLRVDLDLASPDVAAQLERAWDEARAIGAALEVALYLSDDGASELERLVSVLEQLKPNVARWLVFHTNEPITRAQWVELARKTLARYDKTIPFYGGTNIDFMHLNREHQSLDGLDGVAYSVNPQEHAFDVRSLAECPPAIGVTIATARTFCSDKPLAISPITLRRRFNPHIVGPQPLTPDGELPANVDPRQMSLFGAGWTLAALKAVAEARLESVTFYETTGWRGVMETESGSPLPEKFFSRPNMVFPLYHIFVDVAELPGAQVVKSVSNQPLRVESLLLRAGKQYRLLLCNLMDETQEIRVNEITAAEVLLVRLNESSFEKATMQMETFRAEEPERAAIANGQWRISLLPFETVRADWEGD